VTDDNYDLAWHFAFYANSTDETTTQLDDRITALEELVATLSLTALLRLRRRLRASTAVYAGYGPDWAGMRAQAVSEERQGAR
jgi:hypothetical protein